MMYAEITGCDQSSLGGCPAIKVFDPSPASHQSDVNI